MEMCAQLACMQTSSNLQPIVPAVSDNQLSIMYGQSPRMIKFAGRSTVSAPAS